MTNKIKKLAIILSFLVVGATTSVVAEEKKCPKGTAPMGDGRCEEGVKPSFAPGTGVGGIIGNIGETVGGWFSSGGGGGDDDPKAEIQETGEREK